jgi:hypothetical protein
VRFRKEGFHEVVSEKGASMGSFPRLSRPWLSNPVANRGAEPALPGGVIDLRRGRYGPQDLAPYPGLGASALVKLRARQGRPPDEAPRLDGISPSVEGALPENGRHSGRVV